MRSVPPRPRPITSYPPPPRQSPRPPLLAHTTPPRGSPRPPISSEGKTASTNPLLPHASWMRKSQVQVIIHILASLAKTWPKDLSSKNLYKYLCLSRRRNWFAEKSHKIESAIDDGGHSTTQGVGIYNREAGRQTRTNSLCPCSCKLVSIQHTKEGLHKLFPAKWVSEVHANNFVDWTRPDISITVFFLFSCVSFHLTEIKGTTELWGTPI